MAIQTPAPAPTPRLAPEGIAYLIKRVSIPTDTGITAFPEGTEVQVKSASADGILHVEARGTSFDVSLKDTTNDLDKRDSIVATREKINTTATVAIAVKATNSQQRVDDSRASNRGEIIANKKKSMEAGIAAAQAERDKLQKEFDESVSKYTEQHTWNGRFHRNVGKFRIGRVTGRLSQQRRQEEQNLGT